MIQVLPLSHPRQHRRHRPTHEEPHQPRHDVLGLHQRYDLRAHRPPAAPPRRLPYGHDLALVDLHRVDDCERTVHDCWRRTSITRRPRVRPMRLRPTFRY